MELKREQFDQTNPFARQAALVQLAGRASAADLRRVFEAAQPPSVDVVVGASEDGGGIHFTEVPPIPLSSERGPQTLPTVLPRRRRQKRDDDRFVRLGWALAETREYLRYALHLQRSRIARWLGRRRG